MAWLKANMATHFSRKLLGVVKRIERNMGPRDGDPSHHFPRLAGSYLSEVRAAPAPDAGSMCGDIGQTRTALRAIITTVQLCNAS